MLRTIDLRVLTSLETEVQMRVRDIRNEPSIRAAMYTDHEIGVNEHLGWLNHLKGDQRKIVFAALEGDRLLGAASVDNIDRLHSRADWAFYLTESERGGLGSVLELAMLDFVFETLGLSKLNCEVLEGNDGVLRLHKKFHFEEEGFRKSNISKGGKRLGVYLLGLQRAVWQAERGALLERYGSIFERFAVRVHWTKQGEERDYSPIDRIEAARARNNLNWMSILRIALERSPETSKQIVGEIKKIDQEISALTQKLME